MTELEIDRDQWGRPLIIPPGGGKPTAYTRASTLCKAPDDAGGLVNWSSSQTLKGLLARPDLYAVARAATDEAEIKSIATKAKDAAASDAAANHGTALHWWSEQIDKGIADLDMLPPEYEDLLAGYVAATKGLEVIDAELFVVCDELKSAGTLDRLVRLPDGAVVVADVKTGKHASTYGACSVAIQTAVYAHGERYDIATGERSPLHPDLDDTRTLLIHMPLETRSGFSPVGLYELDAVKGWYGARLGRAIIDWRKESPISFFSVDSVTLTV